MLVRVDLGTGGEGTRAGAGGRALRIGPLTVWPPVVLAPMAGITNAPFRLLCREHGAGLYVTEMVTSRALVERNAETLRMVTPAAGEWPRSVQLYGVDPAVIAEAVRILVEEDRADHIDLNFGCPVPKVTRKGGGAALPVKRRLLRDIVRAAVSAAERGGRDVPVTIKMRTGVDDEHLTYLDAGRIAEGEGAAAVALHARTAAQMYAGFADWSAIARLKEAVTTVPVLGNGDIWEAADAIRMMRRTGCDGVVIGRGCLGRPWLFAELAAAFDGRPPPALPRLGQVRTTMLRHAELLAEWDGEQHAVRDFRKHAGWYLKGFAVGGDTRAALGRIGSLGELRALLDTLDPDEPYPPGALGVPRGRTTGMRRVALPEGWLADADDATVPAGAELAHSGG